MKHLLRNRPNQGDVTQMATRSFSICFLSLLFLASMALPQTQADEGKGSPTLKVSPSIPAQKQSQPTSASKPSNPPAPTKASRPSEMEKAQKELEQLRTKPDEFRVLVLGVQIFLGRFGYGIGPYTGKFDEQTQEALRSYQKRTGLPVTGDIDFLTLKYLTDENKMLDQSLPYLPQAGFLAEKWDEEVHVGGSWSLDSDRTLDALQTSRISCYRKWSHCIESTARLSSDHTPYLSIATHIYEIGGWDEVDLVTKPYNGEACTSVIIRINREKKTVSQLKSIAQGDGPCASMDNQDLFYHLVDGPQIYWQLKQRKAEATKQILRVELLENE